MGFYPSMNSAKKVMQKAVGKCKNPHIEENQGCYTVVLEETNSRDIADNAFSKYMQQKLYCGIIGEKETDIL